MSNYLVTGGAGFIGSHLVDSLVQDGHVVTVIDDFSSGKRENLNQQARLVEASIMNANALSLALEGVEYCYHLAAKPIVQDTIQDWSACSAINSLATVNVFEALTQDDKKSIPVVYASSCAVYGASGDEGIGIQETDSLDPQSPYAVDKLACELHAKTGGITRELKSFGARFFNVYGDRQDPRSPYSGVVSKFCENLRKNEPLTIYGDGKQTRDFIHVSDIVKLLKESMYIASIDAPVANFGTGNSITINELADILLKLSGKNIAVNRHSERKGDVRFSLAHNGFIQQLLGPLNFCSLDDKISELLV